MNSSAHSASILSTMAKLELGSSETDLNTAARSETPHQQLYERAALCELWLTFMLAHPAACPTIAVPSSYRDASTLSWGSYGMRLSRISAYRARWNEGFAIFLY